MTSVLLETQAAAFWTCLLGRLREATIVSKNKVLLFFLKPLPFEISLISEDGNSLSLQLSNCVVFSLGHLTHSPAPSHSPLLTWSLASASPLVFLSNCLSKRQFSETRMAFVEHFSALNVISLPNVLPSLRFYSDKCQSPSYGQEDPAQARFPNVSPTLTPFEFLFVYPALAIAVLFLIQAW